MLAEERQVGYVASSPSSYCLSLEPINTSSQARHRSEAKLVIVQRKVRPGFGMLAHRSSCVVLLRVQIIVPSQLLMTFDCTIHNDNVTDRFYFHRC